MPPSKPRKPKRFGDYCFRATCPITDTIKGCPIAKVKGYDKTPKITADTEAACKKQAAKMGGTYACGATELVMLPALDMECSGQIMFVFEGSVKRLV